MQLRYSAFLITAIASLSLFSCTRAGPGSSKIKFQAPSEKDFKSAEKYSSQTSSIDTTLLCFALNVTGPKLNTNNLSCDIPKGAIEGSVPPSDFLSVELPRGEGYKFELIGLLRKSVSEACPKTNLDSWNWPKDKIFSLGTTEGISLNSPEATVTIDLKIPNASDNIVTANGLPLSCLPTPPPKSTHIGRLGMSAQTLVGTSVKAFSRLAFKQETKKLTGQSIQVINSSTIK